MLQGGCDYIMNYEIIDTLRSIALGSKPNSMQDQIMKEYHCVHLLSDRPENKTLLLMNRLVIRSRYSQCASLFERLIDIPYAVVKGAVLAKHAYNDISLRVSSDIDVLIPRDCYQAVWNIMDKEGFVQGTYNEGKIIPYSRSNLVYYLTQTHQAAPFVRLSNSRISSHIAIDVNFDIFWGENNKTTDIHEFLSKTQLETICGIKVKVLDRVREFIALCLHHYKHLNSIYLLADGDVDMRYLCDIYQFVTNTGLDPDELRAESDKWEATPYVYFCIFHANALYNNGALDPYERAFVCSDGIKLLNCIGLNDQERRQVNFSMWDRLLADNRIELLEAHLTSVDKKKIGINRRFLS